jgi:hypothetical protein
MNFSEIELPSNRNFGFFFTCIFLVATAYSYYSLNVTWVYVFFSISMIFFILTVVRSDVLLPLNKLWMKCGLLLGIIVSPIVLGLIFFGVFTPLAILIRLSGRDELKLKLLQKASYWVSRKVPINSESFKNQF